MTTTIEGVVLTVPAFAEHGGFVFGAKLVTPDDPDAFAASLRRIASPIARSALDAETNELVDQLIELGVVSPVTPALAHLTLDATDDERRVLEGALRERWCSVTAPPRLVVLGALGSARWNAAVSQTEAGGPALTLSFEDEGVWLGPHRGAAVACPRCLLHRRLAREASSIAAAVPTHRSLTLAATLLANHLERNAWAIHDLAHWVSEYDATPHVLLRSPACPTCFRPSTPTPEIAAGHVARTLEALRQPDGQEPNLQSELEWLTIGPLASMSPGFVVTHDAYRDAWLGIAGVFGVAIDGDERVVVQQPNAAYGSGFTHTRQRRVLFSEAIERLALIGMRVDVARRTAESLGALAVQPQTVIPPFADGSGGVPSNTTTDWCWATSLASHEPRLVPFDVMVAGRPTKPRGSRLADEPFFTGGATHVSPLRATTHALFELIERDAFMVAWYLQLPLPLLERRPLAHEPEAARAWLEAREISFRCYDLAVDLDVPTVLTVAQARTAVGEWAKGGLVLSACSAPTVTQAMGRGLSEVMGQFTALACTRGDADTTVAEWTNTFLRYVRRDASDAIAFLGRPATPPVRSRDFDGSLEQLVARYQAQGLDPLVKVVMTDEAARLKLWPVKALAPGLLRPSPDRATMRFPRARLEAIARRWGVPFVLHEADHPQA